MTRYYGVIGNRDYIKLQGEKRPFWEFLDVQPDGWLSSLAYHRNDVPTDRPRMWDCGAWSYKAEETPKLGKHLVTPEWVLARYQEQAQAGDHVIAPDHMLIPGLGDLDARRAFNRASAQEFFVLCEGTGLAPMACAHGTTVEERIEYGQWLVSIGYKAIALGGLAGQASRKKIVIEVARTMRTALPGVWLHVLGLSSPTFMQMWRALGIDACDGSSHFKQAFTAGTFFVEQEGALGKFQAAKGDELITAPPCECKACALLREDGVDTRRYGSNESNMGRAAHNLNMLMRAHRNIQSIALPITEEVKQWTLL